MIIGMPMSYEEVADMLGSLRYGEGELRVRRTRAGDYTAWTTQTHIASSCSRCGRPNHYGHDLCARCAGVTARDGSSTDQEALAALRRWAALHGGRAPTQLEVRRNRDLPSEKRLRKKFGSFNAAVEAAGLVSRQPGETVTSTRAVEQERNRQMVTGGAADSYPQVFTR